MIKSTFIVTLTVLYILFYYISFLKSENNHSRSLVLIHLYYKYSYYVILSNFFTKKLIYNLCTICHVMISVSHDNQNQPIFHRGYMMSSRSNGNR